MLHSSPLLMLYSAAIRHTAFSSEGELIAIGGDDPFIAIVSNIGRERYGRRFVDLFILMSFFVMG